MDIHRFLALAGTIQGTFLFIAILGRGWKKPLNYLLAVLALIIALRLTTGIFPAVSSFTTPSRYLSLLNALVFLVGPLMWFYTRHLVGRPPARTSLGHFLPTGILLLSVVIADPNVSAFIFMVVNIAVYPHIGTYQVMMLVELHRFARKARDYVSNPEAVELTWLRTMLIGSIVILLANILTDFVPMSSRYRGWFQILESSLAVLYLFGITYLAIRYPETHHDIRDARARIAKEPPAADEDTRYARNRLGDSTEKEILTSLTTYMRESEAFRDDSLRLSDLAGRLGHPGHTISMILNIHQKENFYQFVNRYRVEAARAALADPARSSDSILTIAYNSGFRSKSTFNTVFREFTGRTPTEYRSG